VGVSKLTLSVLVLRAEGDGKLGMGGAKLPCEYSLLCMSEWFSSSHSSHFLVVPPNSQYCRVLR
jgi:hypothetical protein